MTLYGGRNPFRVGQCAPEDVDHNMRLLSQLHDDLGNPYPGGPYVSSQVGGMVPFKTTGVFDVNGTPANVLDSNGVPTGETITVCDTLGNHGDAPSSTSGYAIHAGDCYQVVSAGEPGVIESGGGEGQTRATGGADLGYLDSHFIEGSPDPPPDLVETPDYDAAAHDLGHIGIDSNHKFRVYTDKPTTTLGDTFDAGASNTGGNYTPSTDELVEYDGDQWFLPKSKFNASDKVKVDSNDTSAFLWHQFTSAGVDFDDTTFVGAGEGDGGAYDAADHDKVLWNLRKRNDDANDHSMMSFILANCNLRMGITTHLLGAPAAATGNFNRANGEGTLVPGTVNVAILAEGDGVGPGGANGAGQWGYVTDHTVEAKVWAFREPGAGYPVLVAKDRTEEGNWWVVWFGCDEVPEPE